MKKNYYKSIYGYEKEKKLLEELRDSICRAGEYRKIGVCTPHSLLIYGAEGTGKSTTAEAFARSTNLPVISASLEDVCMDKSSSDTPTVFEEANKSAPCVLIISGKYDEIGEFIMHGVDCIQQLANGIEKLNGKSNVFTVVVIDVDEKMTLHSGGLVKFDRVLHFEYPTFEERCKIVRAALNKIKIKCAVPVKKLAKITADTSCREIASILNDAAVYAISESAETITKAHVDKSLGRHIYQAVESGVPDSTDERHVIATHEVGHAIVGCMLGRDIFSVSISALGCSGGRTLIPFLEHTVCSKQFALDTITILLAGRTAEKLFLSEEYLSVRDDFQKAYEIAYCLVTGGAIGGFEAVLAQSPSESQPVLVSERHKQYIEETVCRTLEICNSRAEQLLRQKDAAVRECICILEEEFELTDKKIKELCGIK